MLDAAGYPVRAAPGSTEPVSAGWFEENVKIGQYVKQAFEDLDITVDLSVPDRATSLKRIYTDYDYDVAISTIRAVSSVDSEHDAILYDRRASSKGPRSATPPAIPIRSSMNSSPNDGRNR